MVSNIKVPKKLIEVALPLEEINRAGAYEKTVKVGKPTSLHHWWARRPLTIARAVLFAQLVNDPGGERGYGRYPGQTKEMADAEREKLFQIIRDLVKWENATNNEVLDRARVEIRNSWYETCALNKGRPGFDPDNLPAFHDPFAGGGAIPLEAQRLGFESYASDLNPVAVLLNKAMIEFPPIHCAQRPIGPIPKGENRANVDNWAEGRGLAEDVRRYGHWMRDKALERIGHLYPDVEITKDLTRDRPDLEKYIGKRLTVVAWIWARTVKSPNPAFSHADIPLVSSFVLSKKAGREAWIEPICNGDTYEFKVRVGKCPPIAHEGTKLARANFKCLLSGMPVDGQYIQAQGKEKRIGARLMAIVAEGQRERVYLSPILAHANAASLAKPSWRPVGAIAKKMTGGNCTPYGLDNWGDIFTQRQLIALTTLFDLVTDVRLEIEKLTKCSQQGCSNGYGDAIALYLSLVLSRCCDWNNSLSRWESKAQVPQQLFGRHAIPMVWDFSEANIFSTSTGSFLASLQNVTRALASNHGHWQRGFSYQADAASQTISENKVISTDPPYYNNIGYSDLSDFFYVWLRRSLKDVFPDLFKTIEVPKAEELVALGYRHPSEQAAEEFFLTGMVRAMSNMLKHGNPAFPITIYYAFKQSETRDAATASTGWETFIGAVLNAGLVIVGTWPLRTEMKSRQIAMGTNALASSIVLVCKKRPTNALDVSRRDFQRELRETMPQALETMIGGTAGQSPIAPVDLAQAAIGPGMAVFSKYSAVLNQDGTKMTVHDALVLINREITDYLNPESGSFDSDTLFCSSWFDQYGWTKAAFGEADTLARAKGTSVDTVKHAGIIESGGGKVRLLKWAEYPAEWDPKQDNHTPVWEACHHLIRTLLNKGESEAGGLLARMPERGESIRQLAYHLYTLCERKKWAEDARAYNTLVTSWHEIVSASHEVGHVDSQVEMDL